MVCRHQAKELRQPTLKTIFLQYHLKDTIATLWTEAYATNNV